MLKYGFIKSNKKIHFDKNFKTKLCKKHRDIGEPKF